jgi:hypothetical protein
VDRDFSSYNATTLTAIEFAEQCREEATWAMNKAEDAGSYARREEYLEVAEQFLRLAVEIIRSDDTSNQKNSRRRDRGN